MLGLSVILSRCRLVTDFSREPCVVYCGLASRCQFTHVLVGPQRHDSVMVGFGNSKVVNGWQVAFGAAIDNFIGVSPGCETTRAEIVIPVASVTERSHYRVSPDV